MSQSVSANGAYAVETAESLAAEDILKANQARAQQAAQERAVGITSFASAGESGLQCIFKQRYTDFQVNEIVSSGEVLHLTEIAKPLAKKAKKDNFPDDSHETSARTTPAESAPTLKRSAEEEQDAATKRQKTEPTEETASTSDVVPVVVEISEVDKRTLDELFGEVTSAQIVRLYSAVLTHPSRKPRDHITVKTEVIESKATRTQAHGAVRTIFLSKLETATLQEEPGKMTIRAAPPRSNKPQNGREYNRRADASAKPGRINWQELGGPYLHFTLYKENKDTMEVLYFMASQFKVKAPAAFGISGTKDRRGVTVQRVSAHRVEKERLMNLTKIARGWKIGSFEYKPYGLQLGDLKGNEFVITLRDCRVPGLEGLSPTEKLTKVKQVVIRAAADLEKHGYINYYGLQRFGSFQTGTHIVGIKILQNDLKGAINSILDYDPAVLPQNLDETTASKTPQDDIDRAEAIRIWRETRNADEARSRMPRRFQAESNIIGFLGGKSDGHTQERDWQGALMCIQKNLRLMYVHAYQSLVWNNAAVKRRKVYGDQAVEGDLVVVGEKDTETKTVDRTDQDGEVVVHPSEDGGEDAIVRARHLTKEEAESGRWDIFDIVLPLPGWDVLYPSNELGKFYEDFMASEEGGQLDPHNMRRTWKDASLSGGYRKLMSRPFPGTVEVTTHLYSGEQQLAETDADRLSEHKTIPESNDQDQDQDDAKIAVILKLQLGSSQYATMALRELTKGGAIAYRPDFSADRGRAALQE